MIIAICDDDAWEREQCQARLKKIASAHQIPVEFAFYEKGEELLFHLQDARNQPDVIYLDMRLGGLAGDEAAKKLRQQGYNGDIIFFTISKDYYTSAFDVKALHYVVKRETSDEKFEEIFLKSVASVKEKNTEYIMLSGAGEFRNIEIRKIRYFQVVKRIITVFFDEEEFSFYSTIGKIELRLKDYGFIRIHRAYLVSMAHIRSISYTEVLLDNGESLPVGRAYYQNLKQEMASRL